jgi:catechol 2,3-dioxygenase-like lactoylglutathione lyase family enzyme
MSKACKVTHIALKVDDVERACRFWQEVFGFELTARYYQRDHLSVHLTDGSIDLELVDFGGAKTESARAAGGSPCIHHFGIDVPEEEMEAYRAALRAAGCEFISDPGARTVKFRFPAGGGIGEIAPMGWHSRTEPDG